MGGKGIGISIQWGFVKIGMLEWREGISRCATIIQSDRISKQ